MGSSCKLSPDMSAEKTFSVVVEPIRTVYVDSNDETVALRIAMHVQQLAGEVVGVAHAEPPNIERRTVDPDSLDTPQEFEGTKYWVVSRESAK
jgi:hypothetical protein